MEQNTSSQDTDRLFADLSRHAQKVMSLNKISYDKNAQLSPQDTLILYKSVLGKYIPSKRRNVIFSRELAVKMNSRNFTDNGQTVPPEKADEINRLIHHFTELFQNGADINNHLSTGIFDSVRQDMLLNTWGVRHIHLNTREAHSKTAMHKNRSDWLLFVVIDGEKAYFLDVLKHPAKDEFSSYSFLKIAHSNGWLERMGFTRVSDYVSYYPNGDYSLSGCITYNHGKKFAAMELPASIY